MMGLPDQHSANEAFSCSFYLCIYLSIYLSTTHLQTKLVTELVKYGWQMGDIHTDSTSLVLLPDSKTDLCDCVVGYIQCWYMYSCLVNAVKHIQSCNWTRHIQSQCLPNLRSGTESCSGVDDWLTRGWILQGSSGGWTSIAKQHCCSSCLLCSLFQPGRAVPHHYYAVEDAMEWHMMPSFANMTEDILSRCTCRVTQQHRLIKNH